VSERRFWRAQEAITLPPKAYDLLVRLVRNAKRELLAQVWSECSVDEGILAVQVLTLRKVLGDARESPRRWPGLQSSSAKLGLPWFRTEHSFRR
jgi:DNA-binding winged helix-turn-helix (wHTH) protein